MHLKHEHNEGTKAKGKENNYSKEIEKMDRYQIE